jgi:hypothetical protein
LEYQIRPRVTEISWRELNGSLSGPARLTSLLTHYGKRSISPRIGHIHRTVFADLKMQMGETEAAWRD